MVAEESEQFIAAAAGCRTRMKEPYLWYAWVKGT